MKVNNTKNLKFKYINEEDFEDLKSIVISKSISRIGWQRVFTDEEIFNFIEDINHQYEKFGYSYWFIQEKETDEIIGIGGILQSRLDDENLEIDYIFKSDNYNMYSKEIIKVLMKLVFTIYKKKLLLIQVQEEDFKKLEIVERLNMKKISEYNKDNFKIYIYELKSKDYI